MFSTKFIQMNIAFIVGLLVLSGPSAIGRFVITIAINAINAMRCAWSWTHILKKSGERKPSVAKLYTPSTIHGKVLMIGIKASPASSIPYNVLFGLGKTVRCHARLKTIYPKTSARFCESAFQVAGTYNNMIPAVTQALKSATCLPRNRVKFNNNKPFESRSYHHAMDCNT